MNGSCSPKDLETLLQLVYLSFTAPRMDQNAFESYKSRTKAALANQEANPQIALSDSLQKAMYMNHPRALRVKADMIDKLTTSESWKCIKTASKMPVILLSSLSET